MNFPRLRPPSIAIISFALLFLLSAGGCGSSKPPEPPPKLLVSVSAFEVGNGLKPGEADGLTSAFSAELQKTGRFTLVERASLQKIREEQSFQSAQQNAGEGRTQLALPIQKMFMGSLSRIGDQFSVNLRMVNVETSAIEFAASKLYDDDFEDLINEHVPLLIVQILQSIDGVKR